MPTFFTNLIVYTERAYGTLSTQAKRKLPSLSTWSTAAALEQSEIPTHTKILYSSSSSSHTTWTDSFLLAFSSRLALTTTRSRTSAGSVSIYTISKITFFQQKNIAKHKRILSLSLLISFLSFFLQTSFKLRSRSLFLYAEHVTPQHFFAKNIFWCESSLLVTQLYYYATTINIFL